MSFAAISLVLLLLGAAAIYVFGIPKEWKRAAEEKALETMGENKASYMAKDTISKIPASDQKEVKDAQDVLGDTMGGSMKNSLGKTAGNAADDITSPFTGR